jgi:hypothetical protein
MAMRGYPLLKQFAMVGDRYTSPAYDTDAQAYFDYNDMHGGATISSTVKSFVNTLVINKKADGSWSSAIAIYPFPNTDLTSCSFNLKNPGTYTLTFHNSPTITSAGCTWNGTTQYAQTGINASSDLTVDNAYLVYYTPSTGNFSAGECLLGCFDGSEGTELFPFNSSGNKLQAAINDNIYTASSSLASVNGIYLAKRTSSTSLIAYKDATSVITETGASGSTKPNLEIYIAAENSGSAGAFTTHTAGYVEIGNSLTATISTMNTNIQTYLTSMGR